MSSRKPSSGSRGSFQRLVFKGMASVLTSTSQIWDNASMMDEGLLQGTTMQQVINATFEDGVLKPLPPLDLPSHAQVRLTIEMLPAHDSIPQVPDKLAALESLWKHSRIHSQE